MAACGNQFLMAGHSLAASSTPFSNARQNSTEQIVLYMLFDSDNFSIRASFLDAFMKSSYSAKEIKPIFLSSGSIISEPMRLTADPKK